LPAIPDEYASEFEANSQISDPHHFSDLVLDYITYNNPWDMTVDLWNWIVEQVQTAGWLSGDGTPVVGDRIIDGAEWFFGDVLQMEFAAESPSTHGSARQTTAAPGHSKPMVGLQRPQ